MYRKTRAAVVFMWMLLLGGLSQLSVSAGVEFQNGDIIVTEGFSAQAKAVKAATASEWSHVGVVFIENGKPYVFEAVQPVRVCSLERFLGVGKKQKNHCVYRLKQSISDESITKARYWAKQQIGKNYDGRFQWDDQRLYCSELVWKLFKHAADIELCETRKLKSYHLKHPLVQRLIKKRYGSEKNLPLEEEVVAPSDIANSELLVKVSAEK